MGQAPTDADVARQRGRKVGSTPGSLGGFCPYNHSALYLRQAWFMGFGEGRADLKAKRQAEKDGAL